MNRKERFLNACKRKPVDRCPVWLMRQAGRYLPEYRHLRERRDFIELCKTPELACEISLQPWKRFEPDAVIVFSDILFIPEAMGQKLTFKKNEGPKLFPFIKPEDVSSLKHPDSEKDFDFVYNAINLLKAEIPKDVPVIGFSGAPWTLAHYMTGEKVTDWIEKFPNELRRLLDLLSETVGNYVKLQQKAGADVIQIFDTWAGDLSKESFVKFVLPSLQKTIETGRRTAPFIVYSRKCKHVLKELSETGAEVVSIDPNTSIDAAIKEIGNDKAIQGNIDPKILLTTPGMVRQETSRLLSKIRGRTGHIINLGHGILPTSNIECVEALFETVKNNH